MGAHSSEFSTLNPVCVPLCHFCRVPIKLSGLDVWWPRILQGETKPLIVVVDDNKGIAELGANMLKWCGYEAVCCFSADEAKSRLDQCDGVFTDLAMDGETGLELIEWIRSEDYDILIVATSGDPVLLSEAMGVGASATIPKPWELDVLKQIFSELLE